MSARVALTLAKKLFSNCCTLCFGFVLFGSNRFVMRSIKDPHPGSNSASSEATDTSSTKLCANASGVPGYLNLFAPSRPNLNLFSKGKNNRYFCPEWF